MKLHKGKVTKTGMGVYYSVNFDIRNDPKSKVIGNIYECHDNVKVFLEKWFGWVPTKIDTLDCYMPTIKQYYASENRTLYTNIKNIPNYKWNYEPENKIETSEC